MSVITRPTQQSGLAVGAQGAGVQVVQAERQEFLAEDRGDAAGLVQVVDMAHHQADVL